MKTDRRVDEAIARCVSIMVYHHNAERADEPDATLNEDIRGIVLDPKLRRLDDDDLDRLILAPVRDELVARYGHEVGPRLCSLLVCRLDEVLTDVRVRGAVGVS